MTNVAQLPTVQDDETREANERRMGSAHVMEVMRKATVNLIANLEAQRDRQLDRLVAERRTREDGFNRDIAEAQRLVADLQQQLAVNIDRIRGLEEARHAAIDTAQTLFMEEQERFKKMIDSQRTALSTIS